MARRKIGFFSNASAFITKWIIAYDFGQLYLSRERGVKFKQTQPEPFGSSNINDIVYGPDLNNPAFAPDNVNTANNWTTQTSNFGSNDIRATTYGNGIWVAGGANGQMRKSTNGITWTTQTSFANTLINKIAYGNGIWVVGTGNGKYVRTSTDTITWNTVNTTIEGNFISGIAYGNGMWLTLTQASVSRSTDTITWVTVTTPLYSFGGASISYANSIWLIAGYFGQLLRSTDTITWITANPNTSNHLTALSYGNGLWIAVGGQNSVFPTPIRTSTDTITWVTQTSNFGNTVPPYISYANGMWILTSDTVSKTTNGITWTTLFNNVGLPFKDVAYGNGTWIVSGSNGALVTSPQLYINSYPNNAFLAAANDGKLGYSTDAIVWTTLNAQTNNNINAIKYMQSAYIAGGNNIIRFSTNGISWITATINLVPEIGGINTSFISSAMSNYSIANFEYANGLWGGATNSGIILKSSGVSGNTLSFDTIYESKGNLWRAETANFGLINVASLAYGNGLWVAGDDLGRIATSTDTINWITATSNLSLIAQTIAYGNGLWVVGSSSGGMRISTNGLTWTTVTSNFGNSMIREVAYANGLWVAVGTGGQIRTSTNASTWTTVTSNFSTTNIESVAYGNGLWMAGAWASWGALKKSTNAVTWTTAFGGFTGFTTWSIAYGNGIWAAAVGRQIYRSTDTISWVTISGLFNSGGTIQKVIYDQGAWAIAGDYGQFMFSTNAINWVYSSDTAIPKPNPNITDMAYGNNIWTIAGWNGGISTSKSSAKFDSISQISKINNEFVIKSDVKIYNSTDLNSWSNPTFPSSSINKIVSSNGKDFYLQNSGIFYVKNTSSVTWTTVTTGIADNFVNAAVTLNGAYNIVGQSAIYNSTNLINWTTVSIPLTSGINGIVALQ